MPTVGCHAVHDLGNVIGLLDVQVRGVDAFDGAGVVEESIAIADLGVEAELVCDVSLSIANIVDVDFIENIVAELDSSWGRLPAPRTDTSS